MDRLIAEHASKLQAFLVLGPVVIGVLPGTGIVNPFWSALFGLPFKFAARGHPVYGPHPWYEVPAALLWPLVLLAAMTWGAGALLRSEHRWRNGVVVGWAVSAFLVIPFRRASYLLPDGWPIWGIFD